MADHSHLDDATYFRKRATEWRALAQQLDAFEDRNNILAIAKDYDLLADEVTHHLSKKITVNVPTTRESQRD